jgi:predicted nucleic acid-binding protein
MNDQVIDCCSLLNLHTGWRGLAPLEVLAGTWHVCDAVFKEAQYTCELKEDGATELVPLDLSFEVEAGLLRRVQPESEAEIEDYVTFATELDDGEAQALAIAKSRGYTLLTDDRKALRMAAEVNVATTTTPGILRQWAEKAPENSARLPEILRRITTLARFTPPKDSPHYVWWKEIFEDM